MKPQRNNLVYSAYFFDERSSELTLYPLLHLGYDSQQKVKHTVPFHCKLKHKDFILETNNSTLEVFMMLLVRYEQIRAKKKAEGHLKTTVCIL